MSVKLKDIISIMEQIAPPCLAIDGDNSGLLIGDERSEISSILVSLDIDDDVCDEAIEKGVDLIITHHPVIYHPIKNINTAYPKGRILHKLISDNINVYSAHTNLDAADDGINSYLASKLALHDVSLLEETYSGAKKYGIGRVGFFDSPMPLSQLSEDVKCMLGIDSVSVVGNPDRMVYKAAVCSGDGSDFIKRAYDMGCDVYITGDIGYHDACDARDMGLSIIDAGHFAIENVFMGELVRLLKCYFKHADYSLNVLLSDRIKSPFTRV